MINRRWINRGPPNYPFVMNRESPQAKGLVGWWPTLGSRGANVLTDLASGNSGTLVNSPVWVNVGKFGAVLDYESGSSQHTNIGRPPILNITNTITISIWVNFEDLSGLESLVSIFMAPFDGSDVGYFIDIIGSGTVLRGGSFNGSNHIAEWTHGGAIVNGVWYHIVIVYDGTAWRLYVDSIERASTIDVIGPLGLGTSGDVLIGSFDVFGTPARFFDGLIGDTRIYNRALTPIEVYQLYAPQTRWELYQSIQRSQLTIVSSVVPSPGPISLDTLYNVPAEDRVYVVPDDGERVYNVPAEDRIYEVLP